MTCDRAPTAPQPLAGQCRIERPAHKRSHLRRVLRFITGVIDPRAWSQLLKLVDDGTYAQRTIGQRRMKGAGGEPLRPAGPQ